MFLRRALLAFWGLGLVTATGMASANPVVRDVAAKPPAGMSPGKMQSKAVPLTDEQMALVGGVTTGQLPCELAQRVLVRPHSAWPGHFDVQVGAHKFVMVPVATTTGAIRLEDAARGAVWLQLANKSMLMDQRKGRRLADACMSPAQEAVALAMQHNPAPHLLDPALAPGSPELSATK